MFVRTQSTGDRTYLLIVENRWVDGKVKQHVLHRLGRLDQLASSGQLDSLIVSLGRFTEKLAVLGAHLHGDSITTRSAKIGPALICERLWKACSIDGVLTTTLSRRRFEFSVERAVFLTVLHRLFSPGSDRAAEKWKSDYAVDGVELLGLHHLYRAMAWLGEVLPQDQQSGTTPFVPRTNKDVIEEDLFARRRDLFTSLDLVFFDTTSLYFFGNGGATMGKRGHCKDHRPDLKQMVVGMVLDQNGYPVCSEMWPGNTADVKSLVPIVERLKKRFAIGEICIVADRGMISAQTINDLEERKWRYILGVRMRSSTEAKQVVGRAGRYAEVYPQSDNPDDPSPLKVKEVWVEDQRRYVVCLNEDQAKKDRLEREAVAASLRDALKKELNVPLSLVLGTSEWDETALADFVKVNYPNRIFYGYPLPPDEAVPVRKHFVDAYVTKFGKPPAILWDNGYDAVMMLKYGIERAAAYDATKIKDALYTLKDFQGASGLMSFERNGDVDKPFGLKTITSTGADWVK